MILNLPKRFPIEVLEHFTFGSLEAQTDDLLQNEICICRISPIQEFLRNRKSIVVGDRGAGKTALFELLRKRKLQFHCDPNNSHILVPIKEELEYKTIKTQVLAKIKTVIDDPVYKIRIAWEIFILYRILTHLRNQLGHLSPSLIEIADSLSDVFNPTDGKLGMKDILLSQKLTIGVKLDHTSGIVLPSPYVSVEPKKVEPHSEVTAKGGALPLDIDSIKRELNRFLEYNRKTVIVLIDRLDEFVIRDEYEAQRESLQGLLYCERDYLNYPSIKLKLFLRRDLFGRLDFEGLGYDKVMDRAVELVWSDSDILEIIARRIAYNYIKVFKVPTVNLRVNQEDLYLDNTTPDGPTPEEKPRILEKIRGLGRESKQTKDKRQARRVNFNDEITREIITSIFPRQVHHRTLSGKLERMDIKQYLATHFSYGHGYTTPRTIISFLEICLSKTKEYYKLNPDRLERQVDLDENNEFPLVKDSLVVEAFAAFQQRILDNLCNQNKKWDKWLEAVRNKKGNKKILSFARIRQLIRTQNKDELRSFLAFLVHIGFLKCLNPYENHEKRKYEIPILFRSA